MLSSYWSCSSLLIIDIPSLARAWCKPPAWGSEYQITSHRHWWIRQRRSMSDDPLLSTLMDPSNADVFGSRHVDVDSCRSLVLTLIDDQPQCLPGHCDIRNSPFLSCSNKTALHLFGLIEVTKNLVQIMSFFWFVKYHLLLWYKLCCLKKHYLRLW